MVKINSEKEAEQLALEWAAEAVEKLNDEKHMNCKDPKVSSKAVYDEDLRIYDVVVELWCRSIIFNQKLMYRLSIGTNGKIQDVKQIDEGVDMPPQ